jgi:hypothetical protein
MRVAGWLACALVVLPALARAQTINGMAEWTVSRSGNTSDGQPFENNAVWQRYTLGFDSPLWDPRLMKYNAEVSFRTASLAFGGAQTSQEGRERDLGYKLGAALFPARSFPFFIQASRNLLGESGDYPSSNAIRGGFVVPPGVDLPDFRTRNEMINIGWQLNTRRLPRIDFGYRTGSSVVTGGPYHAEQDDRDLHLGAFKETTRTRHALRYQRTSFENRTSQAFNQRFKNLDYDFGVTTSQRSRITVRSGRRSTFSLFDLPSQIVNPGTGTYRPPSRGEVNTMYAIGDVTYEPTGRLSLDLTGSFDQQDSEPASTNAKLLITSARYELLRGLSLTATGNYGDRGQIVGDAPVTVLTRSARIGSSYRFGVRWLDGSAGYFRGIGTNTTPEGQLGEIQSWSGQAGLSAALPWFTLRGGYERANSRDEILDFGNYDSRRSQASVQRQVGRVSLEGSWEHSLVERGRGASLAVNRQHIFTSSASYRIGRDSLLTANAGGFRNDTEFGRDRMRFYGASYVSQLRRALHLTAWLRHEDVIATQTRLDQQSLASFGQLEYRLRLFSFAIEYRHNDQNLQYRELMDPLTFRGHQVLLRIARKLALAL